MTKEMNRLALVAQGYQFLTQRWNTVSMHLDSLWMLQVLDVRAYEARQREYAMNGHKHFYFMTLNGSEVCYNLFSVSGKLETLL